MTLYLGNESPADFVARMRAEHGLPPKCSDPAILGRIASELADGAAEHRDEGGASTPPSSTSPTTPADQTEGL